jgi:predicted ATP-grasp superfamily ATP-dependent carboligase
MATTTIFLYEYITGGGMFSAAPPQAPAGSLLREGAAMVTALAEDFLRLPDTTVFLLRDTRLDPLRLPPADVRAVSSAADERAAVQHCARQAEWTVVIAPEFEAALETRAQWVVAAGGRLLSPSPAVIALAADKHRCAEHLRQCGISTPVGRLITPGHPLPTDFPYPAVLKPRDGAGSLGVQWIADAQASYESGELGRVARLERFCPGRAASVAVLCGPQGCWPLPACRQCLSTDGRFQYLGGETPLAAALSDRAQRLALAAIADLPATCGYLGVDLVLGDDSTGRADVVVEINPRLTTSYVGLRQLLRTNLAGALLAVAKGGAVELAIKPRTVAFGADGSFVIGEADKPPPIAKMEVGS